MISPSSSTTVKSRTFSESSASVRGSRVPSGEYSAMSLWICSTSGRIALRVRMEGLLKRVNALLEFEQRRAHARGIGAARHIMAAEHGIESDSRIKILIKSRTELLQLFEAEIGEFAAALEAETDCLANGLVGAPKWDSL